jgi:hypothetical protein
MDIRKIIRTDDLTIDDIPVDDTGWHEISIFALTFDPMLELGTTDIYKTQLFEFDEGSALQELRRSLFLWQRALNWRSGDIDENDLQKFRNLFTLMRKKFTHQTRHD